jgi:hypothetical protein
MHVCFYQRRALCISAWMDASVRAVDMCEDDLFIKMHRSTTTAAFLPRAKHELGLNLDQGTRHPFVRVLYSKLS